MLKSILASLVLVSISIAGDLKLSLDFDAGFIPKAASREYKTPTEELYCSYDKVLNIRLRPLLEYKFIYGIIDITSFSAIPKSGISQDPIRVTWGNEIGLFYSFESFRISLGWEHNCSHRIITAHEYDRQAHTFDTGYDNIFLRFQFSNR